jgi:hypothetical protein
MHASFGEILSNGVRATNRSRTGLLLLFLLYGWFQGLGLVVGSVIASDPTFFQVQPGQPPPAALVWMMAYGCGSCIWLIAMVLGGPWVAGGVLGQLRDRIVTPEAQPGPFRDYASSFYGRLLLLTVIYVAIFLVLYLILMLVGALVAGSAFADGAVQPQQLQQLNTHPANIAAGVGFMLVSSAVGVLFLLTNAGVVVEQWDALTALGRAAGFIRQRSGDAFRLFLIVAALACVLYAFYWIPTLLELRDATVVAVLAVLMACYFPYMIMLEMAFGMSLWLARRPQSDELPSATPPGPEQTT